MALLMRHLVEALRTDAELLSTVDQCRWRVFERRVAEYNDSQLTRQQLLDWLYTLFTKAKVVAATKALIDAQERREREDDDVVVTGARTREERDAEGRKNAIDLEAEEMPLATRVAAAKAKCAAALKTRYRALLQPALEAFAMDTIDEHELKRRRTAAGEQANAEHAPLFALERAYASHTTAQAAAAEAERTLEAALREALREEKKEANRVAKRERE